MIKNKSEKLLRLLIISAQTAVENGASRDDLCEHITRINNVLNDNDSRDIGHHVHITHNPENCSTGPAISFQEINERCVAPLSDNNDATGSIRCAVGGLPFKNGVCIYSVVNARCGAPVDHECEHKTRG